VDADALKSRTFYHEQQQLSKGTVYGRDLATEQAVSAAKEDL
jgi:hypothetical protein